MDDWSVNPRPVRRPPLQALYVDHIHRRPNRVTEHQGETCVVCETPLSRYNPSRDFCWTHAPEEPVTTNGQWGQFRTVRCKVCEERVPRTDFISIRGRCRACDQKAA